MRPRIASLVTSCAIIVRQTALTLSSDGWLRTGDLASMDDRGYLMITGRLKDMIIRGGENIYPREIEDVLGSHPGVAAVAVIGVPDDTWGEQVGAVIVPVRSGPAPTAEGLRAYCRERLARFKAPSFWYFVPALRWRIRAETLTLPDAVVVLDAVIFP